MFERIIPSILEGEGSVAPPLRVIPLEGTGEGAAGRTTACFVDGGNAPVFESPGVRIEAVRLFAVVYEGRERRRSRREEGLLLIRHGKAAIRVEGFNGLSFSLEIPSDDPELSLGRERVTLATAACLARFILECRLLETEGAGCALLVRDGPLVANNGFEATALAGLVAVGAVGLAKTNTLLSEDGRSIGASASELDNAGSWRLPVRSESGVAISLVRLHPRSGYLFRLDARNEEEAQAAAEALTLLASDPVFLGYPYPLIEADRMARIPHQELATLKMRLMAEAGNDWKRLERLARGSDAHGVLDRIG